MEFIVPEDTNSQHNLISVNHLGKVRFVQNIADCLNAERESVDAVIWDNTDIQQLEELSPVEGPYGWMLCSINIPIYFHLTSLDQIASLSNCNIKGFYAKDPELLIQARNKWKAFFVDK